MNEDPWERLGQLLINRRVELGYKTRAAFARAHNLKHDRGISDIENHARKNFSPSTIAAFEQQYEWEPGSIAAVLAGGDPTPRESAGGRPAIGDLLSEVPDVVLLAEIAKRFARAAQAEAHGAIEESDELGQRRADLAQRLLDEEAGQLDEAARETDVRGNPIRSKGREQRRQLGEVGEESQDPDA